MPNTVLALNAGSSSMKLALFEMEETGTLALLARGKLEGIGTTPHFVAHDPTGAMLAEKNWAHGEAKSHEDFLEEILTFAEHALGRDTLAVVGHRVVHGGSAHIQPERVTKLLMKSLESLIPLAPLHQPHSLAPMRALTALRPDMPQVACFDTMFHHTLPIINTMFPIPREFYELGVKRYGFHGLSYEYIAEILASEAPHLAARRVVVAHLGNGASLCAMQAGRSVDTTMGFTALDGLMMGTRCGTIDPGLVLYLQQQRGMTVQEVEDLLYHKSGLLGVSGRSSDMRELLNSRDPRAIEAIALFVLRIVRETGGLSAVMGGVDGLVFTAGIGEHAPQLRKDVCDRLQLPLDSKKNDHGLGKISAQDSPVEVWVIPTDEEAMIARHASVLWEKLNGREAMAAQPKKRKRGIKLF
jgi:acetate kinase